jgi:hypothetical protein
VKVYRAVILRWQIINLLTNRKINLTIFSRME